MNVYQWNVFLISIKKVIRVTLSYAVRFFLLSSHIWSYNSLFGCNHILKSRINIEHIDVLYPGWDPLIWAIISTEHFIKNGITGSGKQPSKPIWLDFLARVRAVCSKFHATYESSVECRVCTCMCACCGWLFLDRNSRTCLSGLICHLESYRLKEMLKPSEAQTTPLL